MSFSPVAGLPEVMLVQPDLFPDHRGLFLELMQERKLADTGSTWRFVQANLSVSRHGVLRGLHFQNPHPQGKLVSVVHGEIFDVAVDVRLGSPTFGVARGVQLSAEGRAQLLVPPDFAHGFLVLSARADVIYQCTDIYHPAGEHTLRWDDPALALEWPPLEDLPGGPVVSDKDAEGFTLEQLEARGVLPRYRP